ncbi:hypothetical protein OG625_40150 (plasmid) [Streptomyces sp. NBC_01351]|uniref:hypothetical protein n=1 Tax=Streptomyces sp. NBC_01351 TaxID=2903833 RepID=UPI002E3376F4|nr:hypothetical protein [Streptomyces sp. NBC_01351]
MAEAGLLHCSAGMRWAGTVVWTTERGARVAGTGLSARPAPPLDLAGYRAAPSE